MQRTLISPKQQQKNVLHFLSDEQARAVLAYVEGLGIDPHARALMLAPEDDEPFTEEEQARIKQAQSDPRPAVCVRDPEAALDL